MHLQTPHFQYFSKFNESSAPEDFNPVLGRSSKVLNDMACGRHQNDDALIVLAYSYAYQTTHSEQR
jgi:hypothetical protein